MKQRLIQKIYWKLSLTARAQDRRKAQCQMRELPAAARRSQSEGIANEVLMFFRNGKKSAQDVSMNEPIDTDKEGNTLTLMDVMSTEDNIVDNLDIKIKSEQLKKYLVEVLTPRERIIIELRYGLNGSRPLTQREVAQRLKISRSYVSRIEKKALLTLRKRFERTEFSRI